MATPKLVSDQLSELKESKRFWGRAVWVSAIAAVICPCPGALFTVVGMLRAFEEAGKSGQADSKALSDDISFALQTTIWGFVISVCAMVVFAVSLTFFLRRRQALRAIGEER